MSSWQLLWFRLRTWLVNLVVAVLVAAIVYVQWPQAVKSNCFAVSGCSQGFVGTVMLAVLLAGIPGIVFAIFAHMGLTWLLFRPGEIERYKMHRIVARAEQDAAATSTPKPAGRKFED